MVHSPLKSCQDRLKPKLLKYRTHHVHNSIILRLLIADGAQPLRGGASDLCRGARGAADPRLAAAPPHAAAVRAGAACHACAAAAAAAAVGRRVAGNHAAAVARPRVCSAG